MTAINVPNGNDYPTMAVVALGRGPVAVYGRNYAVTGSSTASLTARAAVFDADLFIPGKTNWAAIWAGTNDLVYGVTAVQTETNIQTYCLARQAAGWKVAMFTLLPRSDAAAPGDFETSRQTVNTWIRANWASFADLLVDVAADVRIGDAGDELDLTYYAADQVHLNNTGRAVVAGILTTALQTQEF